MRTRLVRRPIVAGLLLAVAVGGVAGCRTDPNVAAYIGDSRITETELDAAVDQRLEDEAVAAFAAGQDAAFDRRVLGLLIDEEVYAAVAARYDIEVSDDEVRERIRQLLDGQDPDTAYEQLAQQGISRTDVVENVRQQIVRQEVAEAEGLDEGLSEQALRDRYEQERETLANTQLGYITVPDEATADQLVAQLNADPGSYGQLAARYPGPTTLADLEERSPDQVPAPLADAVAAAEPNTAFAVPVPEVGGVVVGFVGEAVYPSFEDVRGDLETEAANAADEEARKVVDEVRDDLDVSVNPRYGVLKEGTIQPAEGGVVDILEGDQAASATGAEGGAGQPTN